MSVDFKNLLSRIAPKHFDSPRAQRGGHGTFSTDDGGDHGTSAGYVEDRLEVAVAFVE